MSNLSTRGRRFGRSDRLFWAVALTALAVAGLYSSARAAERREVWSALAASSCDPTSVSWGYDVALDPEVGYVVAGVRFHSVPPSCAGTAIVVAYVGADGVVHSSPDRLVEGAVNRLDPALLATIAGPDLAATWSLVG